MKIEHLLRESDVEEARKGNWGREASKAYGQAAGKPGFQMDVSDKLRAKSAAQAATPATPSQLPNAPQGSFKNLPKANPVKATATPSAGSGAMSAMANQLSGTGAPAAPKDNTMANTPVSKTNTAKPTNPNAAATTAEPEKTGVDLSKSYSIGRGLKDLAVGTADTVAQVGGKLIGGTAKNIQQARKGLPTGSYDYEAGKQAFGGDAKRGTGVNISGAGGVSTPYVNKDAEINNLRARLARLEKLVTQP
jgi:hypothetical protein